MAKVTQKSEIYALVRKARARGLTAAEIARATGYTRGPVSNALSEMQKCGDLERVGPRPGQTGDVYLLPQHVGTRVIKPYTPYTQRAARNARLAAFDEIIAMVERHGDGVNVKQSDLVVDIRTRRAA